MSFDIDPCHVTINALGHIGLNAGTASYRTILDSCPPRAKKKKKFDKPKF